MRSLVAVLMLLGAFTVATPLVEASASQSAIRDLVVKDEVPVYNATIRFVAQLPTLSTSNQAIAAAQPLINAIRRFRADLLGQQWPLDARLDATRANTLATPLVSDLLNVAESTIPVDLQSWDRKFENDFSHWVNAVDLVNRDIGLPTISEVATVDSCNADAHTVLVAVKAFKSKNPGVEPTKSLLLGNAHGGPYLKKWPNYNKSYSIKLNAFGGLLVAIPSTAKPTIYRASVCNSAF